MKPQPVNVVDEMFPEGAGRYLAFEMVADNFEELTGGPGLMIDMGGDEKAVHADFFNQFDDLYDDDDLE